MTENIFSANEKSIKRSWMDATTAYELRRNAWIKKHREAYLAAGCPEDITKLIRKHGE